MNKPVQSIVRRVGKCPGTLRPGTDTRVGDLFAVVATDDVAVSIAINGHLMPAQVILAPGEGLTISCEAMQVKPAFIAPVAAWEIS